MGGSRLPISPLLISENLISSFPPNLISPHLRPPPTCRLANLGSSQLMMIQKASVNECAASSTSMTRSRAKLVSTFTFCEIVPALESNVGSFLKSAVSSGFLNE